ncbi:hypothetical protein AB0C29_15355 [Actinoplanes sp. NPDC048791]|uniref:hypothetical protein n=1 Tax=Actinoplanes sp. NPDC048791 TaxID=3154623 RepID=UPI0033F152AA
MGAANADRRPASPRGGTPAEQPEPSARAEVKKRADGRYLNDDKAKGADGEHHDLPKSEPETARAVMGFEWDHVTKKFSGGVTEPADGQQRVIFFSGTLASTVVGGLSVQASTAAPAPTVVAPPTTGTAAASAPSEPPTHYVAEGGLVLAALIFVGTVIVVIYLRNGTKAKTN